MKRAGFSLRVHPAGLAALLLALVFGRSDAALAAALALLWHEAAHVLAMALCGLRGCAVELTPFGGIIDAPDLERLSPGKQFAVAISGCAASLALGLGCLTLAPVKPFWYFMTNLNLSLALVNCLPVWPLDGARAVLAAAARFGFAPVALKAMRCLSYLLAVALAALGVIGAWRGHVNWSLLLVGPYLCYAARESSVSSAVRMMRRARDARDKLDGGAILPVRAFACRGAPGRLALARHCVSSPSNAYRVFVITNERGALVSTLTEAQALDALFDEAME